MKDPLTSADGSLTSQGGSLAIAASVSHFEALLWAAILVLLVIGKMLPSLTGAFSPDAVQYLSVARNLLDGNGPSSSVIYFDAERGQGLMPAPQVTFPPGYSIAVAAGAAAGLDPERSALLVSLLAAAGVVFVLRSAGSILRLSPWLVRGIIITFVLNALLLQLAASILSESLFTFVVTLGITLLLAALRDGRGIRALLWLATSAGFALGIAYWIRYSGLFFVLGLGALILVGVASRRSRLAIAGAAAFVISALLTGAGMLRNEMLVGNWRGGNSKVVANPVMSVVKDSLTAFDDLLFGSAPIAQNLVPRVAFLGILVVAFLVLWRAARGADWTRTAPLADTRLDGALALVVLVSAYCAAMIYAGLFTVISYGSRMFAPAVPLVLLLLGTALTVTAGQSVFEQDFARPFRWLMSLALLPYAWLNIGWFMTCPLPQGVPPAMSRLDRHGAESGESPREAILRLVGRDGVLVATDGQMVGHALDVHTVALAARHYSETEWTEPAVREVMARFGARALALSAPTAGVDPADALPSPFLQEVFEGRVPGWLEEVVRNDAVVVLRPRPSPASQPRSSAIISAK